MYRQNSEGSVEAVNRLSSRLGYAQPSERLLQALQHPAGKSTGGHGDAFQRLEYLGDAILYAIISEILFYMHPSASEGQMSPRRADVASNVNLAQAARYLGIDRALTISEGAERDGFRSAEKPLADAFEAILGAIWLDCGVDAARQIVLKLFGEQLRANLSKTRKPLGNAKTTLTVCLHSAPDYVVEGISGPQHEQEFTVAAYFSGKFIGRGIGIGKKRAEQSAAGDALHRMGVPFNE